MNNQTEITINYDKKTQKLALYLIPFAITVILLVMTLVTTWLNILIKTFFKKSFFGFFILLITKSIFYLFIASLVIGLVAMILTTDFTKPLAILDENGIWIHHFGFINWNNIAEIQNPSFHKTENAAIIKIRVKNIKPVRNQVDLHGWLVLFYAQLLGPWFSAYRYINIMVPGSEQNLSPEKIMDFAKQHLKS